MWAVFAVGSAVFAALTSVLAKIGVEKSIQTLRRQYALSLYSSFPGELYSPPAHSAVWPPSPAEACYF